MQTLNRGHHAMRQHCRLLENGGLVVGDVLVSHQLQMARGIKLFEIFSKEARVERRRKLKEDMQHGYFDDFRAVRDQEGKIFASPERLLDPQVSQPFPQTEMVQPDGSTVVLPPSPSHFKAALLCTAFRAGAEDMLESWSDPFKAAYGRDAASQYYELSFVESAVMSVWPFKQMILSAQLKKGPLSPHPTSNPISPHTTPSGPPSTEPTSRAGTSAGTATITDLIHQRQHGLSQQTGIDAQATDAAEMNRQDATAATAAAASGQMQTAYLFHFGDTTEIRKSLSMPNRLTGYAFLIDEKGLVRWRGSGKAKQTEVAALLKAADQLLHPKK